ncbi:hypothetical protein PG984_005203 [Apiospora sp. TS-2023a]
MTSTARPSDPVLRRACDRCHTHKLSCHREASGQCTRCLKANATCTTSPSMRNRRHRRATRASDRLPSPLAAEHPQSALVETRGSAPTATSTDTSTEFVADPHTGLDKVTPDFNGFIRENQFTEDTNTLGFIEEMMNGRYQEADFLENLDTTWWSSPISSTSPTVETVTPQLSFSTNQDASSITPTTAQDKDHPLKRTADGEWLQKLVQVNVRLFAHANKGKLGDKDAPTKGNSFDQTIKISLQFIQALRHLQGSSSRDLPARSRTASPLLVVDPGTMLIVYSCYVRIIEMLIDRLHGVQAALKAGTAAAAAIPTATSQNGNTAPLSDFSALELPTISVCTCTLEDYPILRLRLTLELVEEKLDVMSALLHSMHSTDSGQEHGPAAPTGQNRTTTELPQQALLARGEFAYQILRDIRHELKTKRRIAS